MKKVPILDGSAGERPLLQQIICRCGHETFTVFRTVDSEKAIGLSVCCANCSLVLFATFEKADSVMEIRIPPSEVLKSVFLEGVMKIGIEKATIPDPVTKIMARFFS